MIATSSEDESLKPLVVSWVMIQPFGIAMWCGVASAGSTIPVPFTRAE